MHKLAILFSIIFYVNVAAAQKIDSIYVHLYTDSLKKGTYNYINIDGLLSNGKFIPLDTNYIVLNCSHGTFYGNTLWLEPETKEEKVHINVFLKSDPDRKKEFDMYVKKIEDPALLKTVDEYLDEKKKKKGKDRWI